MTNWNRMTKPHRNVQQEQQQQWKFEFTSTRSQGILCSAELDDDTTRNEQATTGNLNLQVLDPTGFCVALIS